MPRFPSLSTASWYGRFAFALLGVAIAGVFLVVTGRGPLSGVDRALAVVGEDAAFDTAEAAGNAFVRVGVALREQAEDCARDGGPAPRKCDPYFAGSAQAQVMAVQVLRCTRPGVFEARSSMRTYLEALRDDAGQARLPLLPDC